LREFGALAPEARALARKSSANTSIAAPPIRRGSQALRRRAGQHFNRAMRHDSALQHCNRCCFDEEGRVGPLQMQIHNHDAGRGAVTFFKAARRIAELASLGGIRVANRTGASNLRLCSTPSLNLTTTDLSRLGSGENPDIGCLQRTYGRMR
jgi:hypothetical protein